MRYYSILVVYELCIVSFKKSYIIRVAVADWRFSRDLHYDIYALAQKSTTPTQQRVSSGSKDQGCATRSPCPLRPPPHPLAVEFTLRYAIRRRWRIIATCFYHRRGLSKAESTFITDHVDAMIIARSEPYRQVNRPRVESIIGIHEILFADDLTATTFQSDCTDFLNLAMTNILK